MKFLDWLCVQNPLPRIYNLQHITQLTNKCKKSHILFLKVPINFATEIKTGSIRIPKETAHKRVSRTPHKRFSDSKNNYYKVQSNVSFLRA